MTITFAGGRLTNRARPNDPALLIPDSDARAAGWRDFLEGLHPFERLLFTPPDQYGRIGVNGAGSAFDHFQHDDTFMIIDAAKRTDQTIHVMPVPVLQQMPEKFQWVTELATSEKKDAFRVYINGYGDFPASSLGLGTAYGWTTLGRHPNHVASVYATRFVNQPVAGAVAWQWHWRRHTLRASRRDDTATRFVDREDTATLFHELLFHAIYGWSGTHVGGAVDAIEERARQNWLADHPRR